MKFSIKFKLAIFSSFITFTTLFGDVNLTKGLVAHYDFEENMIDNINGNNGTIFGGVKYVDGVIGKGISLNGIDGYVQIKNSEDINFSVDENFTISIWANVAKIQNSNKLGLTILGKWRDTFPYAIRFIPENSNFKVTSYDGNDSITIRSNSIKRLDFYNIVFSKADSTYSLYINGELHKTILKALKQFSSLSDLLIGARYLSKANNFFTGIVDELKIYNRAISPEEIKSAYKGACPKVQIFAESPKTNNLYEFVNYCDVPTDWVISQTNTNAISINWNPEKINQLPSNWTLNGTNREIKDLQIFDNVKIVWSLQNGVWKGYSPNSVTQNYSIVKIIESIPANSGFWVYK